MNINKDLYTQEQRFPQYNRLGKMGSENLNKPPHTHNLAAERSASTISTQSTSKTSPKEDRLQLKKIEESQGTHKNRNEDKVISQLIPDKEYLEDREKLENQIRILKRKRAPCPFTGRHGECFRTDIRCGERTQFTGRESITQHGKPHQCLYSPFFPADSVIVITKNDVQKKFIVNTLKLFLAYDPEKVRTAKTAEEVSALLLHYKLQNRPIGLIILDSSSLGSGAVPLLDELYERNLATEVILISTSPKEKDSVFTYYCSTKLNENLPFISAYLELPLHKDLFVRTVQALNFGQYYRKRE